MNQRSSRVSPDAAGEPALAELQCWDDREPRTGAEHMAWDQALYETALEPWLRVYRWPTAEVTFGYFMRWAEVQPSLAGRPATRRWTGGGLVEHGDDWTFTLIIPRAWEPENWAPRASYRHIHTLLAGALSADPSNRATLLEHADDAGPGGMCFARPVAADVMVNGQKVVGGAQRRGRLGLLHQGSIQLPAIGNDWMSRFSRQLAVNVSELQPDDPHSPVADRQARVRQLVAERYGSDTWNQAR